MKKAKAAGQAKGAVMSAFTRRLLSMLGWLAFGLGWVGIFLPGLPTTVFWIVAATVFLRVNARMYGKIIAHKRFGPGIKLFVEEGRIRKRGKVVSISAMMCFAIIGSLAIPVAWVKILVVAVAAAGSVVVASLPSAEPEAVAAAKSAAEALAEER